MRRLTMTLLVLAIVVHSVVPAGFMLAPSSSDDGSMTVVVCTDRGFAAVTLDADGDPKPPSPSKSHDAICPYAGAISLVVAVPEFSIPQPIRSRHLSERRDIELDDVPDFLTALPRPRGPPVV